MKIMPAIPGQTALPISYARSLERPSESFCRMLSAELSRGQAKPDELHKLVAARMGQTDIFGQLEASLQRHEPLADKSAMPPEEKKSGTAQTNAVDVARVLDFMKETTRVQRALKQDSDGTIALSGEKTGLVAGVRQQSNAAWDKYHMSSSGGKRDVGLFVGFRIALG